MEHSIGKLLKIAHTSLNVELDEIARPQGLTGVQMTIIDFLRISLSSVTQKDIENEFHIQSSTVTVLIDKLEAKKLVKRYKSTRDRRVNKVQLTTFGLKTSESIKGYIEEHDKSIMSKYTPEEQQVILKFLKSFEK